jgi:hypothetical protein
MQSKATTVAEYIASLPEDRRAAISTLRDVINRSIDPGYEEGMGYGMMGWSVPLSRFPRGYHCAPPSRPQPLPYCGLASQKQYISLYVCGLYTGCTGQEDTAYTAWFKEAWRKSGKKLDMGKSCIRFKRVEDVPLDVVAEAVRRLPVSKYLEMYTRALAQMEKDAAARSAARKAEKGARRAAPRKKSTTRRPASRRASRR